MGWRLSYDQVQHPSILKEHSLVETEDTETHLGLQMLVFPETPSIWDSLDFLLFSESQTSVASDT